MFAERIVVDIQKKHLNRNKYFECILPFHNFSKNDNSSQSLFQLQVELPVLH